MIAKHTPVAALLLALAATPAAALDLFAASGAWVGEGQLATGAEEPLARGRCKVDVAPDAGGTDVSVTGKCVVAAGASEISMRLVRSGAGRINAGVWSAATDQVVQLSGTESGEGIELASTTPLAVDGKSYETRVSVSAPDADSFTLRQLMRAEGETAWRLVVDMAYRPAGG